MREGLSERELSIRSSFNHVMFMCCQNFSSFFLPSIVATKSGTKMTGSAKDAWWWLPCFKRWNQILSLNMFEARVRNDFFHSLPLHPNLSSWESLLPLLLMAQANDVKKCRSFTPQFSISIKQFQFSVKVNPSLLPPFSILSPSFLPRVEKWGLQLSLSPLSHFYLFHHDPRQK